MFTTIADDFERILNDIYGVYLDASRGFVMIMRETERSEKHVTRTMPDAVPENEREFIYGKGHPGPNAKHLHRVMQTRLKERNRLNGENAIVIGNLCVVAIYGYWEDHFREEIANASRVKKSDVKTDFFGDLRLLRVSIIHNGGIAIAEISRCKILKWFNPGDQIAITAAHMETIIDHAIAYCYSLRDQETKPLRRPT